LLLRVLTQVLPHNVWPAGHTQRPPEQVVPLGQRLLHVPQLLGSVIVLMHIVPQ